MEGALREDRRREGKEGEKEREREEKYMGGRWRGERDEWRDSTNK